MLAAKHSSARIQLGTLMVAAACFLRALVAMFYNGQSKAVQLETALGLQAQKLRGAGEAVGRGAGKGEGGWRRALTATQAGQIMAWAALYQNEQAIIRFRMQVPDSWGRMVPGREDIFGDTALPPLSIDPLIQPNATSCSATILRGHTLLPK